MNRQSSNNNRRVRWRWLLRWKNALNHDYKNNNGRNFQFTKFSFIDFVLTEVFQVNGQNRPEANLPVVDFHSQPSEMLTPKPLNTQLSVFLLVYWFSSLSRKVWTSLSVSDTDFFSVLAAIIRESSDKLPCAENREGFAVHSSTWPSGAKVRSLCDKKRKHMDKTEKLRA